MALVATSSRISYIRRKKIGSGAFGNVYQAQDTKTKISYALKVIKCDNNNELRNALAESQVMDQLYHRRVLHLYQIDVKQEIMYEAEVCLLFEYCAGGNLNDRLQCSSSKEQNLRWMIQIADGIDHLHSNNIVHRDLKPDNILLTRSEHIKIGDFGFARKFTTIKEQKQTWMICSTENGTRMAYMSPEVIQSELYMESKKGTPIYMAPEVNTRHYTHKADVFSLGLLFYGVEERCFFNAEKRYYGAFLQRNGETIALGDQMLREGKDVSIPFKTTNNKLVRIISSALQFDYNKRPSAGNLKRRLKKCLKKLRISETLN